MSDDVNTSGPIFNGQAALAVKAYAEQAAREVAQEGQREVRSRLGTVLQHPTGRYQSGVRVESSGSSMYEVNDSGIIYGPWLEGTGSRNRTTRFKGYASFRIARQQLGARADGIAERVLPPYLGRMQ